MSRRDWRPLGLSKVPIDKEAGIDEASVINCDGIHPIPQRRLTQRMGSVDEDVLAGVCAAIALALGCDDY